MPSAQEAAPALASSGKAADSDVGFRNVTLAVRGFLSQDPAFKPKTDLQESEWTNGEVTFFVGRASCVKLCGENGGGAVCARDWFAHIDRCSAAQAVFPQGRCSEVYKPTAPSFEARTSEVLVSRDTKSDPPTCEADPNPRESRLCACVPAGHTRTEATHAGVRAVRTVLEKLLVDQEAFDRLELSRGVKEGIELNHDGVQMSSILLQNLKASPPGRPPAPNPTAGPLVAGPPAAGVAV